MLHLKFKRSNSSTGLLQTNKRFLNDLIVMAMVQNGLGQ